MARVALAFFAVLGAVLLATPSPGQTVSHLPEPATGPVTGADSAAITQSLMESRQYTALELRRGRAEKVVPVPPALEIEVLDPRVDPLGNPAVLTMRDEQNRFVVDIPPVVLVHRYYYTGDRSFQGPLIPGGPTILVMNHPGTNERLYLELQMLPGAPRVKYTRHSIEYDYGFQAITLKFGLHGKPSIVYRQGTPLGTRVEMAREHVRDRVGDLAGRLGIPTAAQKVRGAVKNVAETTADRTHDVVKAAVTPVLQVARMTPLATAFTSSAEERATRERDLGVQRASAVVGHAEQEIPTVR